MTSAEIISKFELYVDDSTELSAGEELDLLNKVYQKVCSDRPWELLKKTVSGTISTTVPYVALPADSAYPVDMVVYVGSNYTQYQVVNFSERREHHDEDGYCYLDLPNARLYFTKQPTSATTYEFDYVSVPATLGLTDTPIFPERFHDILVHLMAVDHNILQMFPRAQSYAAENQMKANEIMRDMIYANSQLINYDDIV